MNGPIFEHNQICRLFQLCHPLTAEQGGFHIDAGGLPSKVDCNGGIPQRLRHNSGEQMLTGMLLHVVEPAVPVDPTDYPVFPEGSRKHMRDPRIFIENVENRYSAEFTRIEWLAAGGGVEPGAIQIDSGIVPGSLHNGRVELVKVRVCVIKPFG